jgi:hypothetical protein
VRPVSGYLKDAEQIGRERRLASRVIQRQRNSSFGPALLAPSINSNIIASDVDQTVCSTALSDTIVEGVVLDAVFIERFQGKKQ